MSEIESAKLREADILHRLFQVGILVKLFNGVWETVVGVLAIAITRNHTPLFIKKLMSHELLERPSDFLLDPLVHYANGLPLNVKTFAALYVLIHGLLNLFIAIQLYREKFWAYQVAIGVMVFMIIYQIHRITLHHSPMLLAITIFDIVFVWLTWREYKRHWQA